MTFKAFDERQDCCVKILTVLKPILLSHNTRLGFGVDYTIEPLSRIEGHRLQRY